MQPQQTPIKKSKAQEKSKAKIIALTGGIASGKTIASQFFATKKITILDADQIAHDLFRANSIHLKPLKQLFGENIFSPDGQLDRTALAKIVFNDKDKLKSLNQLVHPLIFQQIKQQASQITSAYGIIDIPLLVDKKGTIAEDYQPLIDRILVIEVAPELQIKRLSARDGFTRSQAIQRLNAQATNQQRRVVANDLLINNRDMNYFKQQLNRLHQNYLKFVPPLLQL